MNIVRKKRGSINEIRKIIRKERTEEELTFDVGRTPRKILERLLIVCGNVGKDNVSLYKKKAKEIHADFIEEKGSSWVTTRKGIRKAFEEKKHDAILLIGSAEELPTTPFGHGEASAWTDFFMQDMSGDGYPDTPVGRVFGAPRTILYHMDPKIIDSDIAVVFDSQPGRSTRHVESLAELGFDVEIMKKYDPSEARLLGISEFILQFSDGVFTSRIHGSPDRWASHNSVILSHEQAASINFEGYPVVFAEACSTAQEGPLLKAFLDQGAVYIGATLDTINNSQSFAEWRDCAFADGWKFGFLDLLDTYDMIGQVKVNVDRGIYERLDKSILQEIERVRTGEDPKTKTAEALSTLEWTLFGNPIRRTTVGPDANFTPGRIGVDT